MRIGFVFLLFIPNKLLKTSIVSPMGQLVPVRVVPSAYGKFRLPCDLFHTPGKGVE